MLISKNIYGFLIGYIVCSGPRRSNGAQGIRIVVQSDKSPSYVDGRIEAFIQFFDVSLFLSKIIETFHESNLS